MHLNLTKFFNENMKYMANVITSIRIICSIVILFCQVFSPSFYVLYLIAGFSDMIDGTIARKMNCVSEFGSKLDSIADFIFFIVCLIQLFPIIDIPPWLTLWITIIALIKVINVISGYIVWKKFMTIHSKMNKVTGGLLFILPLTMQLFDLKYSATVVCLFATFSAIQEWNYIRR